MLAVHSGRDSHGCRCFQNATLLTFLIVNISSNCVCVLRCWMKGNHSGGVGCFQAEAIAILPTTIPCTMKEECEDFQALWCRSNAVAGLQVMVAWGILDRKEKTLPEPSVLRGRTTRCVGMNLCCHILSSSQR